LIDEEDRISRSPLDKILVPREFESALPAESSKVLLRAPQKAPPPATEKKPSRSDLLTILVSGIESFSYKKIYVPELASETVSDPQTKILRAMSYWIPVGARPLRTKSLE
jgi:hypothetical protein